MAEKPPTMPDHVAEYVKGGMPLAAAADGRLEAGAFHRNHAAIWTVLSQFLQDLTGHALEIGSGTGQHVVEFARQSPAITWWPTDLNDSHLRSIAAWREHAKLGNVRTPTQLDASLADWRLTESGLPAEFVAMFCANVIHIAPWAAAEGLFAGAGRHLRTGGRLFLYGPFRRDGAHNAPSNAAFDASLRSQNPEWGVRDTTELRALAGANGLRLADIAEMPANNAILAFERP